MGRLSRHNPKPPSLDAYVRKIARRKASSVQVGSINRSWEFDDPTLCRLVSTINSTEATPISAPPTKAEIGSNAAILQAPNQNLACRVLPVGVVICTAPFGSLGIATLDVPVSLLSPAGASGMRCGLPSMTKIAVPL